MKLEVDLLKKALEIYSPTGKTENMGQFLVEWCKKHNMDAEINNEMVVINPMAESLLMLGHMDTVPGIIKVEKKNDKLFGRGAADAKGPLCAAIYAVQKNEKLWDKVSIIAVPDEEGASKAALYIRDHWKERPCIILEPSTWQGITLSYMGRLGIVCTTTCAPSHPGHLKPFASEELSSTWYKLAQQYIVRLLSIEGNDTEGKMKLDIRFRDVNPDTILSKIPDNIEVKVLEKTLPYTAEKNTKLTRMFLRAVREVGGTPVFKKKTGTSDMNILGEKWKTPMVAYGPGDGRLGHTEEENISIEEYSKGIDVLEKVLGYLFK